MTDLYLVENRKVADDMGAVPYVGYVKDNKLLCIVKRDSLGGIYWCLPGIEIIGVEESDLDELLKKHDKREELGIY